jgi:phosphoserine phosphatase
MSRLFLFDVDSTLINEEVIDLIGAKANLSSEISAITELAMLGQIDFNMALTKRVELLSGLAVEILAEVRSEITLTNGAAELISGLRNSGDEVAVISGGFVEVIAPLMKTLNIDYFKANSFEIHNEKLTGRVTGEIVNRMVKENYLTELKDIGIAFCAKPALKEVADVVIDKRDLREILNYL